MKRIEPPNKNNSDKSEVYAHGYDSALTLKFHAGRTADKQALEHVVEPSRALREMYRVLKPGGVVGIRDIDVGGHLLAPADKRTEQNGG